MAGDGDNQDELEGQGLFKDDEGLGEELREMAVQFEELASLEEEPAGPYSEPETAEPELSPLVAAVKSKGLTLDAEGRLHSELIANSIGEVGRLATRRLLAPHIGDILGNTIAAYQAIGGMDEQLRELDWTKERYESGDRIMVQGLAFYEPDSGELPDPNIITVPAVNNAANVIQMLGIPASIIGRGTGNKYAMALANASMHAPTGMKSLLKCYKELRKRRKDPLRIARYGITGIGAVLYGMPTSLGGGPIHKYVYRPLTTAYLINQGLLMLKMFPDKVGHDIPDLNVIREDLTTQVQRYHDARKKYQGRQMPQVDKDNLEERLNHVNRFLRHHLDKISLRDIDIEYDYSIAKVMGALARADIQHDTCELTPGVLPGKEPLFSWAYGHECMHLDGTKNEGKANFRADRLIEDLAVYCPDAGYDLLLEEMRFAAVGHAFAAKLMDKAYKALHEFARECNERASYTESQRLVKTMVYNELRNLDLTFEDVRAIWRWAYPSKMRSGLFKLQSILGSDPGGGYTLDYYKLLNKEDIL